MLLVHGSIMETRPLSLHTVVGYVLPWCVKENQSRRAVGGGCGGRALLWSGLAEVIEVAVNDRRPFN